MHLRSPRTLALALSSTLLWGCATGDSPQAKKANAHKETQSALSEIFTQHPGARSDLDRGIAYLVCTGSDSYLFALSSGGGICELNEGGRLSYWRFASAGAGAGIGWKKVAYMQIFLNQDALARFKEGGFDGQARAEASANVDDTNSQASANQSVDVDGIITYQVNLMGAAAQATVQGFKYWQTDFTEDFIENDG
ncbi:hypothetical protein SAMN04488540_111102 [Ferrimonas sediminum]|uniref:Lipid-binding SYLF domain-containing protein n=1 Tax=Ferrimonas sediminum TaxID=718193 RepID=A0A1G8VMJ2_9GAMM|nr:hypothetical protein [Ferrimonas sediminum]SDJ67278.1 hypothetical protein SAMN04488540_111102 [Ferrimonas sediminum]